MGISDLPDCFRVCGWCKNWAWQHNSCFGECSYWDNAAYIFGQSKVMSRDDSHCEDGFDPKPEALKEAEKWLEDARYDDEALGLVRGVDYPFSL